MTLIPCSQLARERNWSRWTARRWLRKMNTRRPGFAWMADGEWVTSREELQKLAAEEFAKLALEMGPRLGTLERRVQDFEERVDEKILGLSKQVRQIQQHINANPRTVMGAGLHPKRG